MVVSLNMFSRDDSEVCDFLLGSDWQVVTSGDPFLEVFPLDVQGDVMTGQLVTVEWEYGDGKGRSEVKQRRHATRYRFI